jgi:hypothetical protein
MSTELWRDPMDQDLIDLPPTVVDVWRAEVANRAAARMALRALLGRYLRRRPDAIEFAIGPHGKPALAGVGAPPLQFNMSHTRGLALYAIARETAVGVDVERPRPGIDTVRLARRFITAREADRLAELAPVERDAAFLKAWVRHEATVKCLGTGIGSAKLETLAPGDWPWVAELDPGDGAAAAVAASVPPETVRRWRWRSPTTSGQGSEEP